MKKSIIIISILLNTSFLLAQNTFELNISNDLDQTPFGCIVGPNENFIIAIDNKVDETRFFPEFVKISPSGEILKRLTLENDGIIKVRNITKYSDSIFFALGGKTVDGRDHFWIAKLDYDLNLLMEKEYEMGDYSFGQIHTLIKKDSNILCTGFSYELPDNNFPSIFLIEFNNSLEIKYLNPFFNDSYGYVTHIKYDKIRDSYILYAFRAFNIQSWGQMAFINQDYEIDSIIKIPENVNYQYTTKDLPGNNYLLGAVRTYLGNNYTIGKMNSNHSFISRIEMGESDTDDIPALLRTFDFVDPNKIFWGGTHDFLINGPTLFGSQDNYFGVSLLDSNLNIKWQKYYGYDAFYTSYFCQATKDNGCLLVGTVYDENKETWGDIYILKIDSTGNYIPSSITDDLEEELITIYPNPGKSVINIEISEISEDTYFELYSITGQVMIKEQVIYSTSSISTDNLKQGMYLYRIYNNEKIIKTGKWVKK